MDTAAYLEAQLASLQNDNDDDDTAGPTAPEWLPTCTPAGTGSRPPRSPPAPPRQQQLPPQPPPPPTTGSPALILYRLVASQLEEIEQLKASYEQSKIDCDNLGAALHEMRTRYGSLFDAKRFERTAAQLEMKKCECERSGQTLKRRLQVLDATLRENGKLLQRTSAVNELDTRYGLLSDNPDLEKYYMQMDCEDFRRLQAGVQGRV